MGYPEEKRSDSSSRKGSGEDNHYSNGNHQDLHSSRDMYDDAKSMPPRPSSAGYSGGSSMANLRTSTSSSHPPPPPLPSRQPSTVQRNGSSALPRSSPSVRSIKDDYKEVYNDLCQVYKKKIKPLETTYNFEGFHSGPLSDSDIHAKPFVLLLGQYSTVSFCYSGPSTLSSMATRANMRLSWKI